MPNIMVAIVINCYHCLIYHPHHHIVSSPPAQISSQLSSCRSALAIGAAPVRAARVLRAAPVRPAAHVRAARVGGAAHALGLILLLLRLLLPVPPGGAVFSPDWNFYNWHHYYLFHSYIKDCVMFGLRMGFMHFELDI